MNGKIDLIIVIPDSLKKSDIITREMQVLVDGVLFRTINASDIGQTKVTGLQISDNTTITIELRGIYDTGAMSAPLVYEFVVIDGVPYPRSEIFDITILKKSQ